MTYINKVAKLLGLYKPRYNTINYKCDFSEYFKVLKEDEFLTNN